MKIAKLNVFVPEKKEKKLLIGAFSYEFKANNVYAIIGENGSGKSTLLKELYGQFLLGDQEAAASFIGTETNSKILEMNIYDFMMANYKKEYGEEWFKEVQDDFQKYDISEKILPLKFKDASGGEQKLLKLMCMFNDATEYIFLDEPEFAIDSDKNKMIINKLKEIKHNSCIVVVTHDFEFIKNVSATCLLIEDKKCFEIKSPKNIVQFKTLIKHTAIRKIKKVKESRGIDVNFNFGQN